MHILAGIDDHSYVYRTKYQNHNDCDERLGTAVDLTSEYEKRTNSCPACVKYQDFKEATAVYLPIRFV